MFVSAQSLSKHCSVLTRYLVRCCGIRNVGAVVWQPGKPQRALRGLGRTPRLEFPQGDTPAPSPHDLRFDQLLPLPTHTQARSPCGRLRSPPRLRERDGRDGRLPRRLCCVGRSDHKANNTLSFDFLRLRRMVADHTFATPGRPDFRHIGNAA